MKNKEEEITKRSRHKERKMVQGKREKWNHPNRGEKEGEAKGVRKDRVLPFGDIIKV